MAEPLTASARDRSRWLRRFKGAKLPSGSSRMPSEGARADVLVQDEHGRPEGRNEEKLTKGGGGSCGLVLPCGSGPGSMDAEPAAALKETMTGTREHTGGATWELQS